MAAITLGVAGLALSAHQANRADKRAKEAIDASDPFGPYREQYANELARLMQDPQGYLEGDAGYRFQLEEGLEAAERAMAAGGFIGSGNMPIEMMRYAQGFSSDYIANQRAQLAQLAGAGIAPNAGAGVNAANDSFSRWGDVMASGGALYEQIRNGSSPRATGGTGAGGGPAPTIYNPGYGGVEGRVMNA